MIDVITPILIIWEVGGGVNHVTTRIECEKSRIIEIYSAFTMGSQLIWGVRLFVDKWCLCMIFISHWTVPLECMTVPLDAWYMQYSVGCLTLCCESVMRTYLLRNMHRVQSMVQCQCMFVIYLELNGIDYMEVVNNTTTYLHQVYL